MCPELPFCPGFLTGSFQSRITLTLGGGRGILLAHLTDEETEA